MDHLCELGTDRARRSALDKLPRGLPKTYERILTRVLETHEETQDLVIRALQWLTVAEPALSSKALIEALALNLGDSKIDSDAMTSEEELLKWCSSLIRRRVDNEGLELAHFTVKEYLLSINTDTGPQFTKFKIYPEESNLLLGSICLTYLNLDSFVDTPPPDHIFEHAYSDSKADAESRLHGRGLFQYHRGDLCSSKSESSAPNHTIRRRPNPCSPTRLLSRVFLHVRHWVPSVRFHAIYQVERHFTLSMEL